MNIDRVKQNVHNFESAKKFEWSEIRIVSSKEFVERRDKLALDMQAFLTPLKEWNYEAMGTVLYLSKDNHCGFGVNSDGQLISVFSLERERGSGLVQIAKERGGKHLNCLGDKLRKLYEDAGFKVIKSNPWSDEYAPKNWNQDRFGRPNYYEMSIGDKE